MKCIQFYLALIFNEIIYNVCLRPLLTCIGYAGNLFTNRRRVKGRSAE